MMRAQVVVLILILIITVLLQITVVPLFAVNNIIPDLTLIFFISVSLQRGRFWGVLFGFGAGVMNDIFNTNLLGATAFANSIAAYLAGFFGREQLERQSLAILLVLTLAVLCRELILNFLMAIGTDFAFWRVLFSKAIPHSLYSLILAFLIYILKPELIRGPNRKL